MSENTKSTQAPEESMTAFSVKNALCFFVLITLLSVAGEKIGTHSFPVGPGKIVLIPMVFTMILSLIFTPDVFGRVVPAFKKICGEKEVKYAENSMMLVLLLLGVKMGTAAGPNLPKLIAAGPALILQEFGNLGTMLIGMPFALLLGMRREAVGATVSICREPTLGLISEIYGINSPEDELYPVLSDDGKKVYFSSKGLYGMGGYDLFVSEWDDERQEWGVAENLGFPYSSPYDDLLFCNTPDGNFSLFASNRACSADSLVIYLLKFDPNPVKTAVESVEQARAIASLRVRPSLNLDIDESEFSHTMYGDDSFAQYFALVGRYSAVKDSIR
ncbi:MAG: DUF3100 domain-containing protein, partial [Pyramidobacter sp.]|nr:DUF3100 domain-containing protein [Pyramidobacter sp.]